MKLGMPSWAAPRAHFRTRGDSGRFLGGPSGKVLDGEASLDGVRIENIGHAGIVQIGQVVHQVEHVLVEDGSERSCTRSTSHGPFREQLECVICEFQSRTFESEEMLVLLDDRIPRFCEDSDHVFIGEGHERSHDRQSSDELGNQSKLEDVLSGDLFEQLILVQLIGRGRLFSLDFCREADSLLSKPFLDEFIDAHEGSSANEEDVSRVHLDVLLLGMLAAALGGDIGHDALEHLEKRLLHAFTGDIACDRDIVGCLADLVDLVDVDDSSLCGIQVVVCCLEEFEQQILDIFADISRFGECRGITDGEWDIQDLGQCPGNECLAVPVGPTMRTLDLSSSTCESSFSRWLRRL